LRCDPSPLAFAQEQLVAANAIRQQSFLEQLYLNTSAAETLADDDKQQLVDLLLRCEAYTRHFVALSLPCCYNVVALSLYPHTHCTYTNAYTGI
jgi:hypothetical protein